MNPLHPQIKVLVQRLVEHHAWPLVSTLKVKDLPALQVQGVSLAAVTHMAWSGSAADLVAAIERILARHAEPDGRPLPDFQGNMLHHYAEVLLDTCARMPAAKPHRSSKERMAPGRSVDKRHVVEMERVETPRDRRQVARPSFERLTVDRFSLWCERVLGEIDAVTAGARTTAMSRPTGDAVLAYGRAGDIVGNGPGERLDRIRTEVRKAARRMMDDPFMIRSEVWGAAKERTFCVYRVGDPGVRVDGVSLVSARTELGLVLRSTAPGEAYRFRRDRFTVLQRAEVGANGADATPRDARVVMDAEHQTRSAREWLARYRESLADPTGGAPVGRVRRDSDRRQAFELYDQKALYSAQRAALNAPFGAPLRLEGPAGTGKTTAITKRVSDLLALAFDEGERDNERRDALGLPVAERDGCPLGRWTLIVPHADWVRYTRNAFRLEGGIDASPGEVRTWASLCDEVIARLLGRPAATTASATLPPARLERIAREALSEIDDRVGSALMRGLAEAREGVERGVLNARPGVPKCAETIERQVQQVSDLIARLQKEDVEGDLRRALKRVAEQVPAQSRSKLRALAVPSSDGTNTMKRSTGASGEKKDKKPKSPSLEDIVKDVARRVRRGETNDDAIHAELLNSGITLEQLEVLGLRAALAQSLKRLRARERELVVAAADVVAQAARSHDVEPSTRAVMQIQALAILRGMRLAYPGLVKRTRGHRLPDWFAERHDVFVGHAYIDEYENYSPVDLAFLAALVHPATSAVVFAGDSMQSTGEDPRPAQERVQVALKLASMPEPTTIEFQRQVRQTKRLALLSDALRGEQKETTAPATDPPVLMATGLSRERWATWAGSRLQEIQTRVAHPVTLGIITADANTARELFRDLATTEAGRKQPLVLLSDTSRAPDGKAAIFVVPLDEANLLHGLEFEGVLLMGVDTMAERLGQAKNRLYVAVTRAATYLGFVSEGACPTLLAACEPLASSLETWRL